MLNLLEAWRHASQAEIIFVATSGFTVGFAIWLGERFGFKRGLAEGKLSISQSHAYAMGLKAGQRHTAAFLASSEIPAVRNVGRSLQADRWGQ